MPLTTKIAISINKKTLKKLDSLVEKRMFPNRSKAIQKAIEDKLLLIEKSRLAVECAKLDKAEEEQLSEEGLNKEYEEWPEY